VRRVGRTAGRLKPERSYRSAGTIQNGWLLSVSVPQRRSKHWEYYA
jgi:hypothetical protein